MTGSTNGGRTVVAGRCRGSTFRWSVRVRNDIATVRAAGAIDHSKLGEFRRALQTATQGVTQVVVDLTAVTSICSSGIGVLLDEYDADARFGVPLRVGRASKTVRQQLRAAGATLFLDCRGDYE